MAKINKKIIFFINIYIKIKIKIKIWQFKLENTKDLGYS